MNKETGYALLKGIAEHIGEEGAVEMHLRLVDLRNTWKAFAEKHAIHGEAWKELGELVMRTHHSGMKTAQVWYEKQLSELANEDS